MGHILREIRALLLLFSCLWPLGCGEEARSPSSSSSSEPPPLSGARCDEPEWQIGACVPGEADFEENLGGENLTAE